MTHVYLSQLKCPSGHCVIAAAGEFEDDESAARLQDQVMEGFAQMVASGLGVKHECAICGSRDLHADLARMPQRTLLEAAPALQELERRQAMTARWLRQSRN